MGIDPPDGDLTDSEGRKTPLSTILENQDRLPLHAVILVREPDGAMRRVDLLGDPIATVEFGGPNRGFRTTGLVIGLLVDATLVAVAIAAASYEPPACSPTYTGGGYWMRAGAVADSLWLTPWARAARDAPVEFASR